MTTIQTQRNKVHAHTPQADDVLVRISLLAPAGDGTLTPRHLSYRPISEYQAAVDFAVSMADKMAYPIHVLPLNHNDILKTARFGPFRNLLANLNDQERGEMRQFLIANCAEIMRDCHDRQVRAQCFDVLVKLKVVQP